MLPGQLASEHALAKLFPVSVHIGMSGVDGVDEVVEAKMADPEDRLHPRAAGVVCVDRRVLYDGEETLAFTSQNAVW